jgi:hypothetical protein
MKMSNWEFTRSEITERFTAMRLYLDTMCPQYDEIRIKPFNWDTEMGIALVGPEWRIMWVVPMLHYLEDPWKCVTGLIDRRAALFRKFT